MRRDVLIVASAVVLVAAVAIAFQLTRRGPGDGQAIGSPTPTASPSSTPTATRSPAPTATPAARTPEELADRLGAALEASDWATLETLISPSGWNAGWWASEGTPSLPPAQAVAWLKQGAQNERLDVTVQERPILRTADLADPHVASVWRNFDSRSGGRRPAQNAWLVFRQEPNGNWYWKTAIYNPLAIPGGP